jgi:hypothetical protein
MGTAYGKMQDEGCRVMKRPLGQILLDGEFITEEDLERALHEQRHTNELLGEILVRLGFLDSQDLRAVLSISEDLSSPEQAVRLAAGVRRLLGELLLLGKRITPQQLDEALETQRQTGETLGDVFLRLGLISDKELQALLKFQRFQTDRQKASDRLRLGEILVMTNQITRSQLEHALAKQKRTRQNIGDVLVGAGFIRPEQLSHGVRLQKKLLSCALIAVFSLGPLSAAKSAESPSRIAVSSVKDTMMSIATGDTLTALKVLSQHSEIVVTYADILRGHIDVPVATRLQIQNTNRTGYMVVFHGLASPFKKVIVKGFEKEVVVDTYGGSVIQPYHGRDPLMLELSYRVILSKKIRPGTYAWPLTIAISPVIPV